MALSRRPIPVLARLETLSASACNAHTQSKELGRQKKKSGHKPCHLGEEGGGLGTGNGHPFIGPLYDERNGNGGMAEITLVVDVAIV